MNRKQKVVIAVGTALLLLATLIPPWITLCRSVGNYVVSDPVEDKHYGLLFVPPSPYSSNEYSSRLCRADSIDTQRLLFTYVLVLKPVTGLVLLLSENAVALNEPSNPRLLLAGSQAPAEISVE